MLLENLLCARPAVGPIRPHSLHTLPSASLLALLALLSTGQACPTSRPIDARTIFLSGPFLPRPVHDSFHLHVRPKYHFFAEAPSPQDPLLTAAKSLCSPHLPPAPLFSLRRTQSHLPQCFIFLCPTLSWAFSSSSGVWSCCPTAVSPGPVAIVSGRQVFSAYSGRVCGLSCVPL